MNERIICAAIWYKDFPLIKDDILDQGFIRPINCDRGIVFCGHRHHNCLYQMVAITGKYQNEIGEENFSSEVRNYVDLVKNGILYDYILSKFPEDFKDRDCVKPFIYRVLFGKNYENQDDCKKLDKV